MPTLLSPSTTQCQHCLVPALLCANTLSLSANITACQHCLVPARFTSESGPRHYTSTRTLQNRPHRPCYCPPSSPSTVSSVSCHHRCRRRSSVVGRRSSVVIIVDRRFRCCRRHRSRRHDGRCHDRCLHRCPDIWRGCGGAKTRTVERCPSKHYSAPSTTHHPTLLCASTACDTLGADTA